ncbi:MAG: hypothetical protein V1771_05110 [Chloroflexota bacterium]
MAPNLTAVTVPRKPVSAMMITLVPPAVVPELGVSGGIVTGVKVTPTLEGGGGTGAGAVTATGGGTGENVILTLAPYTTGAGATAFAGAVGSNTSIRAKTMIARNNLFI